jgi:hypothetical protein
MADALENQPEKQPLQDTETDKTVRKSEKSTSEEQEESGKKQESGESTETSGHEQTKPDETSSEEQVSNQEGAPPKSESDEEPSNSDFQPLDTNKSTLEGDNQSGANEEAPTIAPPPTVETESSSEAKQAASDEAQSIVENTSTSELEHDETKDQSVSSETELEEPATTSEVSKPESAQAQEVEAVSSDLAENASDSPKDDQDSDSETIHETAVTEEIPDGDNKNIETNSVAQSEEGDTDEHEEEKNDDSSEEETPDYSQFSREELAHEIEKIAKGDDVRSITDQIREIKVHFDELEEAERQKALEQFISEGGEKEGFEYRPDEYYTLFYAAYDKIRERRTQQRAEREKERQNNLKLKEEILNRLRDFVDSEETQVSITKLKEIQQEWRAIGEVPSSHNRSLWANYHALLDRFYDNRSIYFELKELDRKKNLESKIALAERAEQLADEPDIKKATQELDELHEEYKHIGPIPRDDQEALWLRFKAASDKIHDRRRADVEAFKEQLKENLVEKQKLVEQVKVFASFESDSIKEWNKKTKEIQQLQKQWDSVGSMPRSQAKEVNREFWSRFKEFFANKGEFFKRLDALREENLKKKEELVEKAESLKDSEDWRATSNELKRLQREWKEIGPVPEKFRESVYQRFKTACDKFFERRRNNSQETEIEYQKNLKTREEICEQIEQLAQEKSSDLEVFTDLTQQYSNTGFVPRGAMKSISERYQNAVNLFLENAEELDEAQKKEVQVNIELGAIKSGPGAGRRINQKEGNIRRQISRLEDDIAVWKNNISFFTSSSKQADKLIADVERKIEKATAELEQLKSQLSVLQSMR